MAEFILGSPLRRWARRHEPLRRILWRIDYALVWLLYQITRALPVDQSSRLGERIGAFIGPLMKHKSAIFRDNLAVAFPDLDAGELDALVRKAWGRAGRVLGEYTHLDAILEEPGRLEIRILAPVATYANTARPLVVATPHLANWEVVCSALAKMGIPNASLYSPPSNPLLDQLLMSSRRALNCELLPRNNSARALTRALRTGRSVGVVMDRRVDDGSPIRFFGHDKPSTLMPAKLALKYRCDLVPTQVQRIGDARYRVTFHAPVKPADPGADETAQAADMTRQVHALFEAWIRENPADWFCSKRLWARPGEPPKQGTIGTEESGHDADVDSYAA